VAGKAPSSPPIPLDFECPSSHPSFETTEGGREGEVQAFSQGLVFEERA